MRFLSKMHWALCFLIVIIAAAPVWAQKEIKAGEEKEAVIISPFPVSLALEEAQKDDRGTDVSLVKDITVDFDGALYATEGRYNILVYIDGMAAHEFRSQKLPFTFKWNFKGLKDGTHTVKIEVEEPDKLTVLATQEETVEVIHQEK